MTQAQLDKLDARIDGVVTVSDTSSAIGTLLNNAIPTSVQQITPTDTLAITFDQFRNLPNYYSGDVVIRDTEDNIVNALNEDLLDDRVTTLVITEQSTSLGKATTSGGSTSTADSAITVTASAAKNILSKKVYSATNYDTNTTTSLATYMDISIVDRGSAIANFIETATFPGTSTAADVTGAIDFVEKDGGSITLTYAQQQAYESIPSGILKSNLTTTPSLDSVNISAILSAITDVDTDIVTQTSVLNSSIASAQSSIIADTGLTETSLTSSIVSAQAAITADTGLTEESLTSSIVSAQTSQHHQ